MLDVTRLRVLVAVARHGSVTGAAHALNYAQPSVSHHLARLEAETGAKLIQRAGRGIRLTDAGRLLAERASEVIGRLDAAENELAVFSGTRAGRLRLAAFPSALSTLVPAAAAMLRDKHPGVDLRLTEAEPPEALRMLRAGYVDVALVFRHEPEPGLADPGHTATGLASTSLATPGDGEPARADQDLREEVLLDEPVHVIAPADPAIGADGVPAAAITEMHPADLSRFSGQRWIAGCDRCREHLLKQCAIAGFSPRIAFTTDDFVAVQALVGAGLGLALLPRLALRAARNPGVRTVRLRGTRRRVIAVRYGEPPDSPATALLLEVLKSVAEELLSLTDRGGCPGARRLEMTRPRRCMGFSTP
ncbi:MAG: LysR family transcriptional regulator [Nocardiopsaceae bacterium]|nr:LysR family transcriptional regulator [Nocardiopsaceae bacterium]